jgi:hypothetical protein
VVGLSEVVAPPRSRLSPSPRAGRGGDRRPEVEVESEPGGGARRRPSSGGRGRVRALGSGEAEIVFRVEVEPEPGGRARLRPSFGGRGRVRALGSGEAEIVFRVEVEPKPWGRARRRFLWRPRLDLAAVSLTLAGGIAVGAAQTTLFSCQVSQWRGEVTAVTSALSIGKRASG